MYNRDKLPTVPPMGPAYGSVLTADNHEIFALGADLKRAKDALDAAQQRHDSIKSRIEGSQRRCVHTFLPAQMNSAVFPGYTTPGDPPGTMGVDWRGPMSVPSETKVWWERRCTNCGLVERTQRSEPTGATRPIFPS